MPKPRFSQIGALVFPKENVSLGIFDMLGGSAYRENPDYTIWRR